METKRKDCKGRNSNGEEAFNEMCLYVFLDDSAHRPLGAGTIAFSLDLDLDAPLLAAKQKIAERMGTNEVDAFNLVYGGKILTEGPLSAYGIGKEATVHVQAIPPPRYIIVYNDENREVTAATRNPNISAVARLAMGVYDLPAPPELYKDGNLLNAYSTVSSLGLRSGDTLQAKRVEPKPVAVQRDNNVQEDEALAGEQQEDLFATFLSNVSSDVEVAFSFDTTGSMSACLQRVRAKLTETVNRLTQDIPNIRIGIIAHGDYCDGKNLVKSIDLTNDVAALRTFVDNAGTTGGGDAPEAYEYALREANKMSWTGGCSKALVVIGDEVPHPPKYTDQKIDWFEECDLLRDKGVKIYGVRALNQAHASPFYEEISYRTGGRPIQFKNFDSIVQMFLAICYREASPAKLQEFQAQMAKEGKMEEDTEVAQIMDELAKPNVKVEDTGRDAKKSSRYVAQAWFDFSMSCATQYYWNGDCFTTHKPAGFKEEKPIIKKEEKPVIKKEEKLVKDEKAVTSPTRTRAATVAEGDVRKRERSGTVGGSKKDKCSIM
ncbi:hypothetical protein PROFUN_11421 [Planoprotostelium fungivorum]|uniref:Ubiquitin-like domain-containing protein n=1 Tax=Planoprotostelium fungivorum TaxID=1890364 RepID=A0A2P6NA84_9EUKA|nr:hypothetical protein PROFUN_11421 [Planoprotostelium fungivorum]